MRTVDLTARCAVMLAAGRGRRMGGPKALMSVNGEAWWRRQERRLEDAGVRRLWVVSPEVGDALTTEADAPTQRAIADPDAPMFESLLIGVRSLAERPPAGVFVLPIDVPVPGPATLRALAASPRVSVPCCDGVSGHPAHLPWVWVRETLLEAPPRHRRLDRLIEPVRTAVEVRDPDVLANLNTIADVHAWMAGKGPI